MAVSGTLFETGKAKFPKQDESPKQVTSLLRGFSEKRGRKMKRKKIQFVFPIIKAFY